jgi:hypothetical protein
VSECLRRARGGVRGGVQGGAAPENLFLGRHIFAGFEPTYYRRVEFTFGIRALLASGGRLCRQGFGSGL